MGCVDNVAIAQVRKQTSWSAYLSSGRLHSTPACGLLRVASLTDQLTINVTNEVICSRQSRYKTLNKIEQTEVDPVWVKSTTTIWATGAEWHLLCASVDGRACT